VQFEGASPAVSAHSAGEGSRDERKKDILHLVL
jgi:hypothetical protein